MISGNKFKFKSVNKGKWTLKTQRFENEVLCQVNSTRKLNMFWQTVNPWY